MKRIDNLRELFVEQLLEQYDGERQQVAAFPKLRALVKAPELRECIDGHMGKSRAQIQRLEHVFENLGVQLVVESNIGVKGLVEEALNLASRCMAEEVCDVGIITSVQHLNHHNIASYGTLRVYADELGLREAGESLGMCLEEERLTDRELSQIAIAGVNIRAIQWPGLAVVGQTTHQSSPV